jgi:cytochrome bd-type quinol oxidase subunit 2
MDFVFNVIVVLHFVGLAALLGGFIVQMKSAEKGVNAAMWHGALTQLVTGVLMMGLIESGVVGAGDPPEWLRWKLTVKLLITVVVAILAFLGRRRSGAQVGLWGAIGGLTLVNVVIAVFWSS